MDTKESLYKAYIDAKNKWLKFAYDDAVKQFEERKQSLGKTHDTIKCKQYLFTKQYSQYIENIEPVKKDASPNTKKIYKKLSLIYHPDKFLKTDKIFVKMRKFVEIDDFNMLSFIDRITSDILACSDEQFNILFDDDKLKKFHSCVTINNLCFEKALSQFDSIIIEKVIDVSQVEQCFDSFMNTNEYRWYIGNDKIKSLYESFYLTDDELFEYLKNVNDSDELLYYGKECKNEKILQLICEKVSTINIELRNNVTNLTNESIEYVNTKLQTLSISFDYYIFCNNNDIIKKYLHDDSVNKLYIKAIERFKTEFDFSHFTFTHRIINLITLNITEINNFICDKIIEEFTKYLNLPPYDQKLFSFCNTPIKIFDILKCDYFTSLQQPLASLQQPLASLQQPATNNSKVMLLFNDLIDVLVKLIENVDVTDSFCDFMIETKNEKLVNAVADRFVQYSKQIPNITIDNFLFRRLCSHTNDTIRNASLKKLCDEKESYKNIYDQFYQHQ